METSASGSFQNRGGEIWTFVSLGCTTQVRVTHCTNPHLLHRDTNVPNPDFPITPISLVVYIIFFSQRHLQ